MNKEYYKITSGPRIGQVYQAVCKTEEDCGKGVWLKISNYNSEFFHDECIELVVSPPRYILIIGNSVNYHGQKLFSYEEAGGVVYRRGDDLNYLIGLFGDIMGNFRANYVIIIDTYKGEICWRGINKAILPNT